MCPRSLHHQRSSSAHRGLTLIELLLVLAILVLAAAAAMPALRGTLQDQRLKRAADQVRIEWTRAHVQAMKTGRMQMFRYEMGGQAFRVEPWMAGEDALEAGAGQSQGALNAVSSFGNPTAESVGGPGPAPSASPTMADGQQPQSDRFRLPDEVTFAAGNAQGDSRAMQVEQAILESERTVEWSRPILFYPDGSATDAFVVVAGPRQTGIRVELRGLTGTASVSDISAVEELMSQ